MRHLIYLILLMLAACGGQTASPSQTPTPSATLTPSSPELTATVLIDQATQTAVFIATNPAVATEQAAESEAQAIAACTPGETNTFDGILSDRIQSRINEAEIKDTFVSVVITEQAEDCTLGITRTEQYIVGIEVSFIDNDAQLTALVERVLAILVDFPPGAEADTALLSLRFEQAEQQRMIEGAYAAALAAFDGGTRGTALITALGGWK